MDLTLFAFLSLLCCALVWYSRQEQQQDNNGKTRSAQFTRFQWTYLLPYFVMSASDWMQGPYVFALYRSYQFTIGEIGLLFIVGFGSSMVFGTIVGSISDKSGRKKSCLAFAACYIIACLTKHSDSFAVLLIGRVLSGIATSILFSAFESWMVSEHFKNEFNDEWLGHTFYLQVFGNGIVAIVSGLLSSFVVSHFGVMTAPFDVAIIFLVIGAMFIYLSWPENYGNAQVDWRQTFISGYHAIRNDRKVLFLGLSQSMFEGAMYIFVFMWTPALDHYFKSYSHGMVFSCYMVAVMIGSTLFNILSKRMELENLVLYVFVTAGLCLTVAAYVPSGPIILLAFLLFEACVGMFWPSISTLKGAYIPEEVRSTVMNYFRIPTNMVVLLTLNNVQKLHYSIVFSICVCLILVATISQMAMTRLVGNELLLFGKKAKLVTGLGLLPTTSQDVTKSAAKIRSQSADGNTNNDLGDRKSVV